MKEWKIVIGSPGKIIVGNIKVESNMVDARTHSVLNRRTTSRSSDSELNLTGFMRLTDAAISEHNNREYQETRKYKEYLFKKDDIFFVYDENQPKIIAIQDSPVEEAAPSNELVKKKSHYLELTTKTSGNSYYLIEGLYKGFLRSFEDSDFIQLSNSTIIEFIKREDGFLKLKYDKKSLLSVSTNKIEAVSEIENPG